MKMKSFVFGLLCASVALISLASAAQADVVGSFTATPTGAPGAVELRLDLIFTGDPAIPGTCAGCILNTQGGGASVTIFDGRGNSQSFTTSHAFSYPGDTLIFDTVYPLGSFTSGYVATVTLIGSIRFPNPCLPGQSPGVTCPQNGTVFVTYNLSGTAPVVVTPLPAALPLFATGLGALGLLGWRRKRRSFVMEAKILGVVAAFGLLGVLPASATTYTYSGNPMSVSPDCCVPPSTTFFGVQASVQFNFDTTNTSGSFDLSSGMISAASLSSPLIFGSITYPPFTSFASVSLTNGAVTGWHFFIMVPGPGGWFIQTTPAGDITGVNTYLGTPLGATATAPPSTWSGPITDEFSVVPLPATLPLFATGLGVLGLIGWRTKRKVCLKNSTVLIGH
jgi:hypothetical protein